jgi:hypothetical protein
MSSWNPATAARASEDVSVPPDVPASVVPVSASEVVLPVVSEQAARASSPANAIDVTPFLIIYSNQRIVVID